MARMDPTNGSPKSGRFTHKRASSVHEVYPDPAFDASSLQKNDVPQQSQVTISLSEEEVLEKGEEVQYHVYGRKSKILIVILASAISALSPLAANIYIPVLSEVAKATGATFEVVSLSVTFFLIGQAVVPSLVGPFADVVGRRQVLIYTMVIFLIASIGVTFATTIELIIFFRFLQAVGVASSSSLGTGVIADIVPSSERGTYMGVMSGIKQFSMAIGPVIGGLMAGTLGYTAIFWTLSILGAAILLATVLVLPETLRSIAGNGSVPLRGFLYAPVLSCCAPWRSQTPTEEVVMPARSRTRLREHSKRLTLRMFYEPLLFFFEKDIFCILVDGAVIFAVWSMVSTSSGFVMQRAYGLDTIEIGLAFLPNALGCALGSVVGGKQLDHDYHAAEDSYKYSHSLPRDFVFPRGLPPPPGFPLERARLRQLPNMSAILAFAVVLYGFAIRSIDGPTGGISDKTPLVVPLMAQFAIGYASTVAINPNVMLMVELYPGSTASAASVNNLTRYMFSAVGVGLTDTALEHVGVEWFFLLLGGAIVLASPMAWLEWEFGTVWREQRMFRLAEREERRGAAQNAEP